MAPKSTPQAEEALSASSSCPASSSSSCPASSNQCRGPWKHDVFLSFRGEDTRTTFTDHLYHALEDAGIHVFRDNEDLRRGEDISSRLFDAIRGSRVSVVVFSRNYAESCWCLEELATIMECRQASGQLVLPLFYDIDPSNVRRQGGSFMAAFQRHEQSFTLEKDKVARWKAAATEAGNLSGWDLKNSTDRHEGKTIKMIVRAILEELNQTHLDLARYPVGIESRLEELSSLLKVGADSDVRFIGICGMGGIGKTTLAKAVYNRLFHSFQGKCFLADVRENFDQPDGKVHLQEQLLCDVLGVRKMRLSNVHQGINVIKERLNRMRVLIVLDDVTHSEQLAVLAREHDWFGPGSRIVVTTRHLDLLKEIGADSVYMAQELNNEESLQLFSHHAFMNCCPGEELMDLLEEMVTYCKGLPLALQVLGSFLLNRSLEEWKSLLRKLKDIPHNRIQKQLRISFDSLGDDKEKELFLDIACFFIGFDRDYAVKVLDGCGLFPEIGVSVLTRRCLLEVDKKNKLKMHDLIRDMGREIVREKSFSNPGRRSRLWSHEDVLFTLQNHLGTEEVEGIALNSPELATQKVDAEAFSRMTRLRLLQLNCLQVTGDYRLLSKDLRWLVWHKFPLSSIPKDFSMARLVVLDMQYSNLREVWKDDKFLGNLKVLNLSYSPFLTKTPDFMNLPNLEELILRDCIELTEVHLSIGYLRRLVSLNLRNCKKLKKIPESICRVKSLRTLDISGCKGIQMLPEKFGDMESLTEFLAEGNGITVVPFSVTHIRKLTNVSLSLCEEPKPSSIFSLLWSRVSRAFVSRSRNVQVDSLFKLSSLRTLRLANCGLSDEATNLMDGIGSLQFLENLDLRGNQFSALPDTIGGLPKLEKLLLDGCTRLESLPSMPPSLFVFSAVNCISLKQHFQSDRRLLMSNARCQFSPNPNFDPQLQQARAIVRMEWCKNRMSCVFLARNKLENFLLKNDDFDELGNTFFQRSNIPDWFDYQCSGPSLSFHMPPLETCKLKGVTICVVYTSDDHNIKVASPSPVYKVTITNTGGTLELIHQSGRGGDGWKIRDPAPGEDSGSYMWLLYLPHQIVFREELSFEGEVEIAADSDSTSLRVKRIGIHFGSQVCRYCHFDSSTERLSEKQRDTSGTMHSTSSCEFDLFQATPSRPRQTLEQDDDGAGTY